MILNVQFGVANGTVPADPADLTDELLVEWQSQGVSALATSFASAAAAMSVPARRTLRSRLAAAGIRIVQFAGVNANLSHPDPVVRRQALERVRQIAPVAADLGAERVISGCGTVSDEWRRHFYAPHPANHSRAIEEWLTEGLSQVGSIVADSGLGWSVECHQLTTMRSPEVIRRVLDAVDSPSVLANFDPVNLLDSANSVYRNAELVPEMLTSIGPRLADTVHIKDVSIGVDLVCHIAEVAPGFGQLDFDALFEAINRRGAPTKIIIEHLSAHQTRDAVEWVRAKAGQHGLVAPA